MASQDYATVSGQKVSREHFLYAPPGSKPSEWKLPVHDKSHAQNALARFNQTGLPAGVKSGIRAKLIRVAKKFGIDTSGFEGKKQMANIHLKKFSEGKDKGRFGVYMGETLMGLMPSKMSEDEMKAKCGEMAQAMSAVGMEAPAGNDQGTGALDPAGQLQAAEGASKKTPAGADDENNLASKSSKSPSTSTSTATAAPVKAKMSDVDALKLFTYPATDKKRAGKINLSEAAKLSSDGTIDASLVFRAQAAENLVNEAVSAGKFTPKERPFLMKQALSDPKGFEEFVAARPVTVKFDSVGHEFNGDQQTENAQAEVNNRARALLSERKKEDGSKDYRLTDAIREIATNEPELWKRYIAESRVKKSTTV
jgi:hypothetical protein